MKARFEFSWLIVLSLMLAPVRGRAEIIPGLSSYFDQKISSVEESLANEPAPTCSSSASLTLQDINVDFTPSVTFGVSKVLSLTVSPEVDLVFVPAGTP